MTTTVPTLSDLGEPDLQIAQFRAAERLCRMGSWTWDPDSNDVTWSRGLYKLLEQPPEQAPALEIYMGGIPEPYRTDIMAVARQAIAEHRAYEVLAPMVTATRSIWVKLLGEPVWRDGRTWMVGAAVDVTVDHEREQEVQRARDRAADALHGSTLLIEAMRLVYDLPSGETR